MSKRKSSPRSYGYLSQLSTERLEALLARASDGEDEDYVEAIIQAILAREAERPTGRLADVERAWADFQSDRREDPEPPARRQRRPLPHRRRLRRVLATAALAVCVMVLAAPLALGYSSIVEMIGSWSEERFWFQPEEAGEPGAPLDSELFTRKARDYYGSLEEALEDFSVDVPVVPAWMPEGFTQVKAQAMVFPGLRHIPMFALYENGDRQFYIAAIQHGRADSLFYDKDDSGVELYRAGGVDHYLFHFDGHAVAAWYNGTVECSIEGDLTEEELRRMIDSIYW